MKITKAIRIKEGNALIGLDDLGNIIHVCVYRGISNINIDSTSSYHLYEEDTESYEPVSVYSFNRMLRLAQYRINGLINV